MTQVKNIFIFLILFFALGYFVFTQQEKINHLTNNYSVLIVHEKGKENHKIIKAYKSILEEEGVPFDIIDTQTLLSIDPSNILQHKPAIIFPDNVNSYINYDIHIWIEKYINSGGNTMLVHDTGVKTPEGYYRSEGSIFNTLLGMNINTYNKNKKNAMHNGTISFNSKNDVNYFEIPPSKVDSNYTIVGYKYGALDFPYANIEIIDKKNLKQYAHSTFNNHNIPILIKKQIGKGNLLYVNLPLGYLKGNSDDMLPRAILKTFLFKIAHLPHIVSSPNAKGGLVINFHIDSALELDALPWLFDHGYFLKPLKYSMHITAGPFCDTKGDNHGFDVQNKGKVLIKKILPYGMIGSHGGWAHNWFAKNIKDGIFKKEEIKKYIKMNNDALEKVTGYPIKEYAAPDGVFPQPVSTEILKELGMTSFYYPGDSGSAPNRTFYNGEMVSKDIIAFPVMTFKDVASLFEFKRDHYSKETVFNLLKENIDFVINNRTVRLYYTHPYDIHLEGYESEVKNFLYYGIMMQERKELKIETMSYFRDFLLKVINTKKLFHLKNNLLTINLSSDKGFNEMVIAIPKKHYNKQLKLKGYDEDENYYYIQADTNSTIYQHNFFYE